MKTLFTAVVSLSTLVTALAQGTFEGMSVTSYSAVATVEGVAGWTFQPKYSILLTDLGCTQDVIVDNGGAAIRIGLWANNILLVDRFVSSTSPVLFNQTRYEPVEGLVLSPDTIYHIGAFHGSGSISLGFAGPSDRVAGDAIDSASIQRTENTSGFGAPTLLPGTTVVPTAANFRYVPEPSSLSLLGMAALALFWRARKR